MVDEVVWSDNVQGHLRGIVERIAGVSALVHVARWIQADPRPCTRLKEALQGVCLVDPPLQSVEAVAAAAQASVSSLESKWRAAFGPAPHLSLRRFVMWIRLLWAVEQMSAGMKAAVVAIRLGIDVRTLTRTATILTGDSLGSWVSGGAHALLAEMMRSHDS